MGAIIYTFRDSAAPILAQLKKTPLWVVLAICMCALLYDVVESVITYILARQYNPDFKFAKAMGNTFYCAFYRVATLGSGAGVAAVYYLNENGVAVSQGFGMYMIEYALHKISIAIFSGIFFLLNFGCMWEHFADYTWLMVAGYAITIVITVVLVLFCSAKWFHDLLLRFLGLLNRKGKLDVLIAQLTEQCMMLEGAARRLLKKKKLVIETILLNLLKAAFWYGIPYLIFVSHAQVTITETMAVTAMSVMLAAVIPSPAGIGSTEFVFTALFASIVGTGLAGSASLLYRFGTFVFPFLIGAVVVIVRRILIKRASSDL
ncbi:MAG: flippase-like domain-containing protein [Roseburia sp.]|nr:flippase-like domain-containing protein [Roseburia sp.]MDD6216417.1 lysylphosphatidylglycerol synthase transmembrane domain-containing protein [Roseburia sp.]